MVYCWVYNSHYWTAKDYIEATQVGILASGKALDTSHPYSYSTVNEETRRRLATSSGCIPLAPWHIALIVLGGLLLLGLIIGALVALARALSRGGSRSKV